MAKVSKTAAVPAPDGAPSSHANLSQGITTTQRAYTLRLRPAISDGDDAAKKWRELQAALWATHEAINNGAKAFGVWLLTLRGGLDHTLADAINKKDQKPSAGEVRDRRVLLALSWLSVEDERGAPKGPGLVVAYGDDCKSAKDSQDGRDRKAIEALRGILAKRGLSTSEIDAWVADCEGSLKARIRDDAVWVNRSAAFDALCKSWKGLTRANASSVLAEFFGAVDAWVSLPVRAEPDADEDLDEGAAGGGGTGGGGGDGEEFRTKARSFLSTQFGSGTKGNKQEIGVALIRAAKAVDDLRSGITGGTLLRKLCKEFTLSAKVAGRRWTRCFLPSRPGWLWKRFGRRGRRNRRPPNEPCAVY